MNTYCCVDFGDKVDDLSVYVIGRYENDSVEILESNSFNPENWYKIEAEIKRKYNCDVVKDLTHQDLR